jgi:predicted Zn-dependent peptidase
VKGFYARHYTPDNAVLTIAGKFERDQALRLVRRYFGDIRKEGPARAPLPAMPREVEPRQAQLEDNNAKTPGFYFGFLIPPSRTPEHYPLELAALVLADGESSRLWRSLVREKAVAQQVFAWTDGNVGPDVLGIFVALTENARLEDVQALVASELQRLAEEPVSEAELQKIKTRLASAFVFGLQTNLSRATRLGEYEALHGDGRLLLREPARYGAVTPGQLRAAVRAYLGRERRQLVEVLPGSDAPARAAASVSGDSR